MLQYGDKKNPLAPYKFRLTWITGQKRNNLWTICGWNFAKIWTSINDFINPWIFDIGKFSELSNKSGKKLHNKSFIIFLFESFFFLFFFGSKSFFLGLAVLVILVIIVKGTLKGVCPRLLSLLFLKKTQNQFSRRPSFKKNCINRFIFVTTDFNNCLSLKLRVVCLVQNT